jgi:hypothetical protein
LYVSTLLIYAIPVKQRNFKADILAVITGVKNKTNITGQASIQTTTVCFGSDTIGDPQILRYVRFETTYGPRVADCGIAYSNHVQYLDPVCLYTAASGYTHRDNVPGLKVLVSYSPSCRSKLI